MDPPMSNSVNNGANSSNNNVKRPVAKHACLACREKKIKCDGEILSLEQQNLMHQRGESNEILYTVTESGEIRHRQCSNCKNLNVQCIFVKSQRGGRKKKDISGGNAAAANSNYSYASTNPLNSLSSLNITGRYNEANVTPLPGPPQHHQHYNHQQHHFSGNNYQYGHLSTSVPLSSASYLQHPQPSISTGHFQYPAASSQPIQQTSSTSSTHYPTHFHTQHSSGSSAATSYASSHVHRSVTGPATTTTAQETMKQIQTNGRNSTHSDSSTSTPPYEFNAPSKLIFSNPASKPFEFADLSQPSTISPTASSSSCHTNDISAEYIYVENSVLARFDLPPWPVTTKLIDLYYRYIHPSRPFLPPKHRLIYDLNVRNDASLLHAMFVSSCRFINPLELPSSQMKDPEHWYFLAEKYWDYLNYEKSLQALVLLMGSLGPNGYVQQSIEGCERIFKLFKLNNLLEFLDVLDFEQFKSISTKRQIINYEDLVRTVWGSWKLNVFLRINRGVPFKKISESLLEFPENVPLPLSDLQFNQNCKIYNEPGHNSVYLQELQYKRFEQVRQELQNADTSDAINDEACIILAVRAMEMIMNEISTTGPLSLESIESHNEQLDRLLLTSNRRICQFFNSDSTNQKPTYTINISQVFAVCISTVAKLSINVLQCSPILLVKPHRTDLNKHPDYVFNSLNESKIHEIEEACLALNPHIFSYYIKAFIASFEIIKIIELGYGITHDTNTTTASSPQYVVNPNVQVVGGPTNLQAASKISSMKNTEQWWVSESTSAKVTDLNDFPDAWLQYPVFSVVCVGQALTVLASSVMLTKQFSIIERSVQFTQNDRVLFEMLLTDGSRLPLELTTCAFNTFKENFTLKKLNELIKLCSKYIHSHGKYWAYIESISDQADGIVNYIDDLVNQRL